MKEKKTGRVIVLIAFALIICSSRGIWFFAEKYLDAQNYENRQMAERPEMTLDHYGTFSADYTSYFNDHLPFRNDLVSLHSAIDYFCFGRSSSNRVAIGKDNWLFYIRKDDGDPISCYKGTNLFTEEELAKMAQNCIAQRDFLAAQGKEFVLFIAPNKERIYPEQMPERYGKPADHYRALQIFNYLKANTDVRVVYPYDDLMEAKDKVDENLYYKTDSHWNYIGGYVGATALLRELGIDLPPLFSDGISITDADEHIGDLAVLLHLSRQLTPDREYKVEGYDLHNSECTECDPYGMWSYRAANADPRCIYVIKDSFAEPMADHIGSQFKESHFRHFGSYTYNDLTAYNPDIVVYETVERLADRLLSFSIQ